MIWLKLIKEELLCLIVDYDFNNKYDQDMFGLVEEHKVK